MRIFWKVMLMVVVGAAMSGGYLWYVAGPQRDAQTKLGLKQIGAKGEEVREVREGMLTHNGQMFALGGGVVFVILGFYLFYPEVRRLARKEKPAQS